MSGPADGAVLWNMVRQVAMQRATVARNRGALAEVREAFNRSHAGLITLAAEAEQALLEAETQLKGAAEAHFRTTGEKNPAPGVAIRIMAVLSYEEAAALAWAKDTGLALVPETFDRKALEKIAKATDLPFVTITAEGRATLAADLEAALQLAADVQPTTEASEPF